MLMIDYMHVYFMHNYINQVNLLQNETGKNKLNSEIFLIKWITFK